VRRDGKTARVIRGQVLHSDGRNEEKKKRVIAFGLIAAAQL